MKTRPESPNKLKNPEPSILFFVLPSTPTAKGLLGAWDLLGTGMGYDSGKKKGFYWVKA